MVTTRVSQSAIRSFRPIQNQEQSPTPEQTLQPNVEARRVERSVGSEVNNIQIQ
jgi:hypothetical protein